jgi:hypothetical protein
MERFHLELVNIAESASGLTEALDRLESMFPGIESADARAARHAQLDEARSCGDRIAVFTMRAVWRIAIGMITDEIADIKEDPDRGPETTRLKALLERFKAAGGPSFTQGDGPRG